MHKEALFNNDMYGDYASYLPNSLKDFHEVHWDDVQKTGPTLPDNSQLQCLKDS